MTLLSYWSSTGRLGQPLRASSVCKNGCLLGMPSTLHAASSTNQPQHKKAAVAVRLRALKYSSKSRFAELLEQRFFFTSARTACALWQFA